MAVIMIGRSDAAAKRRSWPRDVYPEWQSDRPIRAGGACLQTCGPPVIVGGSVATIPARLVQRNSKDASVPQVWKPTPSGKLFTTTPDWVLVLDGDRYTFSAGGPSEGGSVLDLTGLSIHYGAFWATVQMPTCKGRASLKLDGIPNEDATGLVRSIKAGIANVRETLGVDQFLEGFDSFLRAVGKWSTHLRKSSKLELEERGWLG